MKITDTRIRLLDHGTADPLLAIAAITIDDCFVVHDLKVIEGARGIFVAMPSRKMAENDFRDIAHPLNQFTRDMIKEAVFDAYDRELRAQMNMSDEEAGRVAAKFF